MNYRVTIDTQVFEGIQPEDFQYIENSSTKQINFSIQTDFYGSFNPHVSVKVEQIDDAGNVTVIFEELVFNYHFRAKNGTTTFNLLKNK